MAFLGLLEHERNSAPYLLGELYSLADLVVANATHYAGLLGVKPKPGSRTHDWLEQCMTHPALSGEWGL